MGDFNINLPNCNNDEDTTTFLDTIFSISFSLFINMHTRVANTSETLIDNIFYNKPLNNNMIDGNLCSVISDYLIQFLIEPSSYMHNSSTEKIIKTFYKNYNKEKLKADLEKVSWQKFIMTLTQMFLSNIFKK